MTVAWIVIIARFLGNEAPDCPLPTLADTLLARCGGKDYLLRFYSRERLMSPEVRATFLQPDLAPIEVD